jgi:hypothetical protein
VSHSKVIRQYGTFVSTLSKSEGIRCNLEGTRDSHVAIDCFQWPLLGHYLLEVYLTPHSLDSPCASHTLLAIMEHLVCGANSRLFDRAQLLSCKLTVIAHTPLGRLLLSVTTPCRERKPISMLVSFLLTSESMQSMSYSLGEAYLKVGLRG